MSSERAHRMTNSEDARIRRITKDDLLSLLNKNEKDMLNLLRKSQFGFSIYLNERKYDQYDDDQQLYQNLEIVLEILGRVSSVRRTDLRADVNAIVRMLKDSQLFLFKDIPRALFSCFTENHDINLVRFMLNYMTVLRTLLRKDCFPHEVILNEIFPILQNYMNRLQERRFPNFEEALECFKNLERDVERFEDAADSNQDEEDSGITTFRSLSVVPKSNDVVNCEVSSIPQNIVDAAYKSVDHYLSVHYRLMREDMLRSFRECIKIHLSHDSRRNDATKNSYFEEVSVGFPPEYTVRGILYDVVVSTSKEVDFSKKGTLTPGSLVFLTPDRCNSVVFATVWENPKSDFSKSKRFKLKLKLEDDLYQDALLKDTKYEMIEPSAFFECYKHVLSAIKEFSESNFPLSDIITYFDYSDPAPEYLHGKEYCLHEKCDEDEAIYPEEKCPCKRFVPLKDDDWPAPEDLKLDGHQYNAYKIALTKKVAVIQGPPGTGKTYIGVKVVKALLRNVEHKPIVICCLTNHALDQFLERMLDFTKKMVRLGSQSKSELLEPHKLENLMYAVGQCNENTRGPSSTITETVGKKSIELVKKLAPAVLSQRIDNEMDEEFRDLKNLSDSINSRLISYAMCLDKYLDDSALNDIIDSKYKNQLRNVSGTVRKSLSASLLEWLVCSRSNDLYDKCKNKFNDISKRKEKVNPSADVRDIWALTESKRFELFYYWRKTCLDISKKNLEEEIEKYRIGMMKYKNRQVDPIKLEILKGADIIGVTTTGACKYKALLRYARPCIMVIEEAAQVLESHIMASLVPSIQHLILIGDHEQLRPLPADNELKEKYNLKVSMFERLFTNEAPSATLVMQHRMKPCIAELLVPKPYAEYTSAENVYKYKEIKGVESSVFFFDHRTSEDDNSSGTSASSVFEARMVVSLAKYLYFVNYRMDQITILTTYSLQVSIISKYLAEENLGEIYVTTVDNYQGEENDIILLSFVRSNSTTIGFLKEGNRVCVALSRARMGMFCFGNFQLFADRNDFWKDIVEKLRVKSMIGETLSLKCPRHNIAMSATSANDILEFLSAGCSEDCKSELPCKHICGRKCHFDDPDHVRYLCKQPCEKMIDETRVCDNLCYQRCRKVKRNPVELPCGHFSSRVVLKCFQEVTSRLPCSHFVTIPCHVDIEQYVCPASERKILNCGHEKQIRCFQRQKNIKFICTELRQEIGPCGHTVEVPCSVHFDEKDLLPFCKKSCGILLDCGHPCVERCRSCFDTGIHGFCREKCELVLTCGHKCEGHCGSPCPPCEQKCFIFCGHETYCTNRCLRSCIDCLKPCLRRCRHQTCSKKCWEKCDVPPCSEPCSEKLDCGHRCIGLCGDTCPFLCRVCNAEDLESGGATDCYYQLECGHVIEIKELNEHIGNCLLSYEWPCCPQCSEPIRNSTRYKEKLKRAKQICIDSYDTSDENARVLYLVESMYGIECIVPAHFQDMHKEVQRILKQSSPRSDALMVLKNCVILLKKLVNISSRMNEHDFDEYIQGKFSTLMLWIRRHLTKASYQQLRELEIAVTQLEKEVASKPNHARRNYYFAQS